MSECFLGLLMSKSFCIERRTRGTATGGSINVAMEQRLNVLTAERATRKITQTTEGLDLPKSSKFWKICIQQLDSVWSD